MLLIFSPDVHIEWVVTVGNLISIGALLASAYPLFRVYRWFLLFMGEHEVLIDMACQELGISRREFATRSILMIRERAQSGSLNGSGGSAHA